MMVGGYVARPPGEVCQRHEELQALIGRAILDDGFRRDLLNGHRVQSLSEFALTPEEHTAVVNIRADDLQSFAASLDAWIRVSDEAADDTPRWQRAA